MKRKTSLPILGLVLILGALLIVPSGAVGAQGPEPQGGASTLAALGTPALSAVEGAFTYQGRLNDGGDLANGTYDFEFKLYKAASGGSQVGSTVTKGDVAVTDGLFTVELDFGSGIFDGDARWLEIGVRLGSSTGAYTTLTPRQALMPAPYALALPGLRTEPNADSPNVIGGYSGNSIVAGAVGATISGGGASSGINQVTSASADWATIGGDRENAANGEYSTVSGGGSNTASNNHATVGGGGANTANGEHTTIAGGLSNTTSTSGGTVGGGRSNAASGGYATVPGGRNNTAAGDFSFAAGYRANANHNGSFVWADSTDADFASTANDQFIVRASGGVTLNVTGGALRLEPNATSPNVIGGYSDNSIVAGAVGATISGGGASSGINQVTSASADWATIGGGRENTANGEYSTVSGGGSNTASNNHATVGGGGANTANGEHTTIAGGLSNTTSTSGGTVGGGRSNAASGGYATVPGGRNNTAAGDFSFATGYRANANHNGSFVWADSNSFDFASTVNNEFSARATGGVRFVSAIDGSGTPTAGVILNAGAGAWSNLSDRNLKENFAPVDAQEVLAHLGSRIK